MAVRRGPAGHAALGAADREAWLRRPETVELLRARNADRMLRTRRSLEAQAGLMLRRDLPYYAPAEAIALLEDGRFITNLPNRLRISRLLTDGRYVPPDYGRAAQPFLSVAAIDADYSSGYQQELLRIGYLAAEAARTPVERAEALRIVSAAALDGRFDSKEVQGRLLRRTRAGAGSHALRRGPGGDRERARLADGDGRFPGPTGSRAGFARSSFAAWSDRTAR